MKRGEKTPDDLNRPDGNSLLENYALHDIAEKEIVARLEGMGFELEAWGIDKRHDSGDSGVIYDNKMDFKVYLPETETIVDDNGNTWDIDQRALIGLLDVKSKSSARWMGEFNNRHYDHYADHAEEFGVPAVVSMFEIDKSESAIVDEFHCDVSTADLQTSRDDSGISKFPDGNHKAFIPEDERVYDFDTIIEIMMIASSGISVTEVVKIEGNIEVGGVNE